MSAIRVFPDAEALTEAAADLVVLRANAAITSRGRFALVLSGGSTPQGLYRRLASAKYVDRIDWACVHLYWGDERCVPPADAASNYRLAREALIDHVPIPQAHVHRIRGEGDPAVAAEEYERMLHAMVRDARGDDPSQSAIDLVLLGLGSDGHTASLFPGEPAVRESSRWVVAQYLARNDMWRVTLTLPALNSARSAIFLVVGADKAPALGSALGEPASDDSLPAQRVRPSGDAPLWMVDRAAAQCLAR